MTPKFLMIAAALCATPLMAVPYTASSIPFAFTDISGTGTAIAALNNLDDAASSVALPFGFNFYGVTYNSVGVSTNGLLTFGGTDTTFTNANLTTSPTLASIAVFWDDLHTNSGVAGAGVYTQTDGAAGNRLFTVQWNLIRFFSGGTAGDTLTFQAVLSESNGNIQFNYLDLLSGAAGGNNGASATVGVKAAGVQGPDRLLLAFNDGPNEFVGGRQSTLITDLGASGVPEPSSFALLSAGVALLAGIRRYRSARL
jgi:hypothetical protein